MRGPQLRFMFDIVEYMLKLFSMESRARLMYRRATQAMYA